MSRPGAVVELLQSQPESKPLRLAYSHLSIPLRKLHNSSLENIFTLSQSDTNLPTWGVWRFVEVNVFIPQRSHTLKTNARESRGCALAPHQVHCRHGHNTVHHLHLQMAGIARAVGSMPSLDFLHARNIVTRVKHVDQNVPAPVPISTPHSQPPAATAPHQWRFL